MDRQTLAFYLFVCIIYRSDGSIVRLVDSKDKYEGRLEVYHNSMWANVCDDEFSAQSASVVCKMLRISRTGSVYTHKGGRKSIMLDNVMCKGTEHDIMSCQHTGWGNHDCSHDEDVGVRCDKTTPFFRLSAVTQGVLTLTGNGNSLAVCNKNVTNTLPSIICKSYGLEATNVIFTQLSSKYSLYYDGLYCIGNAHDFSKCIVIPRTSRICDEGFVSVKCLGERLVDGTTPFDGRLQVWNDGVWGNVCDDGFDNNAASVVCRSLRLSWNGKFSSEFKGGTTAFILDDVKCNGTEASIRNCGHSNWKSTNCDHTEDVGINCSPCSDTQDAMDLSLVGGPTKNEGFAQIKLGKHMINICSDEFDHSDAIVFCREMSGNESAAVVSGNVYNTTSRQVMQETFHCTGNETKLVHCPRISMSSCPEHHKAAIVCNPTPAFAKIEVPTLMTVNETVNATCIAIGGNPAPLIWWNCSGVDGPTTVTVSPNQVTSVLTITPSYLFNGEKCSCFVHQVETVFLKIEQNEILEVHYPVLDGLNVTAPILTENEFGNLTCEVSTGNPLPVLWWECSGVPDKYVTMVTTQLSAKAILHIAAIRNFNGKICKCYGRQMNTSFSQLMESTVLNVHSSEMYIMQVALADAYNSDRKYPSVHMVHQTSNHKRLCTRDATKRRRRSHMTYAMNREVSLSSAELPEGKPELLICRATGGNPRPIVRMVCSGILRHGSQVSLRYLTLSVMSVLPTKDLDGQNCTCVVNQPSTNFPEIRKTITLRVLRIDGPDYEEDPTIHATTDLQLREENIIKTIRKDNN